MSLKLYDRSVPTPTDANWWLHMASVSSGMEIVMRGTRANGRHDRNTCGQVLLGNKCCMTTGFTCWSTGDAGKDTLMMICDYDRVVRDDDDGGGEE